MKKAKIKKTKKIAKGKKIVKRKKSVAGKTKRKPLIKPKTTKELVQELMDELKAI